MSTSYNAVTVGTSATTIVASNPSRRAVIISNASSAIVYVGPDSNVTTATGTPIPANGSFISSGDRDGWRGVVYGIVASATSDVRYWEFTA